MTRKTDRRLKIKRKIRGRVEGTAQRPRLSVFRSNKQIYAQLIDDLAGVTLASASSRKFAEKMTKIDTAALIGKEIAEKGIAAGITTCTFDRNGYLYHGRIKSLAEAAREGGLKF